MASILNITPPATELAQIQLQEQQLVFPSFTAETAWELGNIFRGHLLLQPKPAMIDISLASHPVHTLFHCAMPGTIPDNENWVSRKRKTVLRFGTSTWYMKNKYNGDEALFASKNGMREEAGSYAIHGGGWPIRVRGVEGVVGVIVVSGLAQSDDHGIIVKVLREYLASIGEIGTAMADDEIDKKKEE